MKMIDAPKFSGDHGSRASSNRTDDVGASSTCCWIPLPAVPYYNPTTLRCCQLDIPTATGDDDQNNQLKSDEVDTTLRLSNYGPTNSDVSPAPSLIRWPRPDFLDGVEDDDVDTTLSLRLPGTADPNKAKGKRRADDAGETRRRKTSKRRNIGGEEDSQPLLPIERIPTLMRAVESRNGSRPTFLYGKILEESDVKSSQNRLFVTRRKRTMEFLRAEEAAAVDNIKAGLKDIVGVDGRGNVFEKLVLKEWGSVGMTVINSDWRKVVAANEAEKGDVVEIWGFRVDEKPCFAFNFRRDRNAAGTSAIYEGSSRV